MQHPSDPLRAQENPSLVGIVLAGGLSSRLGHDKALVRLENGEMADLLARSVTLLQTLVPTVAVVGRTQTGYHCLPDLAPGHGPVGGIATALTHFAGSACLVVSCDLPFMEKNVLTHLVDCRNKRPEGTMMTAYQQEDTGHIEALVAIYEPEALPDFQHCVEQKLLKISKVVPESLQYFVPYTAQDSLPFFNINYPADLEIARRVMQMMGKSSS